MSKQYQQTHFQTSNEWLGGKKSFRRFSYVEKKVGEFQPGRKAQEKDPIGTGCLHNTGKDNLVQMQNSCLVRSGC